MTAPCLHCVLMREIIRQIQTEEFCASDALCQIIDAAAAIMVHSAKPGEEHRLRERAIKYLDMMIARKRETFGVGQPLTTTTH